uniref:Mu-conotoxin BuIIIC n=2 Tax=Conus bullatus TaxID=89438 RepID=CM3C_CONBU|nr:RecName: Full=Mu-conotoxin BuIIIC; Flags: Precursor [Conus bullatus]ACO50772.1 mu-conopeptide BuIIIC [Conus bullatus]WMI02486.1 Bu3.6 protein [Conus bullatus]
MMSKLGVLLTICLLLFPLFALPQDGDQPADRPAERMQDDLSSEQHPLFEKRIVDRCCNKGNGKRGCSRWCRDHSRCCGRR